MCVAQDGDLEVYPLIGACRSSERGDYERAYHYNGKQNASAAPQECGFLHVSSSYKLVPLG